MNTAIYTRVSGQQQTTENQRPDIDRLVAARGYTVTSVYDEQVSAVKYREQFERMMQDAKDGKFQVLVIWALDRFGRSMGGNIRDVLALDALGIRVVSCKEPWMDTESPVRDLLVAIFSWVAQQDRERLIERTKAGLVRARGEGRVLGRPNLNLIPEKDRHAVVALWRMRGRPGGLRGLGQSLGGVSQTWAWKIERDYPAKPGVPVPEYGVGTQDTSMSSDTTDEV